jgi:putative FmdB family regulatory protein
MPIYEYRCGQCEKHFDATQSVHARAEDTECPHCHAQSATRLLSACTMLDERMDKFAKLPPLMGKRAAPDMTEPSDPSTGGTTEN